MNLDLEAGAASGLQDLNFALERYFPRLPRSFLNITAPLFSAICKAMTLCDTRPSPLSVVLLLAGPRVMEIVGYVVARGQFEQLPKVRNLLTALAATENVEVPLQEVSMQHILVVQQVGLLTSPTHALLSPQLVCVVHRRSWAVLIGNVVNPFLHWLHNSVRNVTGSS